MLVVLLIILQTHIVKDNCLYLTTKLRQDGQDFYMNFKNYFLIDSCEAKVRDILMGCVFGLEIVREWIIIVRQNTSSYLITLVKILITSFQIP
jgi:hypothetical protein